MLPPSQIFDPARTHCPSCNATLAELVAVCPFCGFNAHICVERYPFAPPPLSRFIDPDRQLQRRDRRKLAKSIGRFEKRFPQVTISVAYVALPENTDGREFGFWYVNRAGVADEEERQRRLHHMLILADRTSHTVSVTVGYGLDCFIDDQFLYLSLERTAPAFQAGGLVSGIRTWLDYAGQQLIGVHKESYFARDRWLRHIERTGGSGPLPAPIPAAAVSQGYKEVTQPVSIPQPRPHRAQVPDHELS